MTLTRKIPISKATRHHEWLVSNGLGGYASGTISGEATRRYHNLLVSALPAPLGRMVTVSELSERVRSANGDTRGLAHALVDFRLEMGLPVWTYRAGDALIEKRLRLIHLQNTVHVTYRLLDGAPVRLKLRPSLHFRPHEDAVTAPLGGPYQVKSVDDRFEVSSAAYPLCVRMHVQGDNTSFTLQGRTLETPILALEVERGYDNQGKMYTPGYFAVDLGRTVTLIVSTEEWETIAAISPETAVVAEQERRQSLLGKAERRGVTAPIAQELVLAADQFVIAPAGRQEEAARAHAEGDEVRTVIAGYHWFTDWGRDTMISLEGLTLATGRSSEAGYILRTFAHYVKDGLIPNMFPEGEKQGLYHTADATLWFFHAIHRYVTASGDRSTLDLLLPTLHIIIDAHQKGTRFGIRVTEDGLLHQGEEGYQLTWMDAKVDNWVVTPRRGKAVEINALYYNALKLLEGWTRQSGQSTRADVLAADAAKLRDTFNRRFWFEKGGYLFDVVDGEAGDDNACRPNQIFAIALDHPVLDESRWQAVMEVARAQLLTPVGLRSLAPGSKDYKAKYDGDLRSRDAAYHQGTVWGWLIGPMVDAWRKVHPGDDETVRGWLRGFAVHLSDAGVGSVSEIFDAEAPYTPRGCIAQAWSVAELLRCMTLVSLENESKPG